MITFQIVPYNEIESLTSVGRIRKLLNITKEDKIVLLQGKLKYEEEKELIKATMEEVNHDFKGIEITTIDDISSSTKTNALKKLLINVLLGDRQGITIIGPASIVKEIKKDPSKIELYMTEQQNLKKRRR
jgi:hypothetical protein